MLSLHVTVRTTVTKSNVLVHENQGTSLYQQQQQQQPQHPTQQKHHTQQQQNTDCQIIAVAVAPIDVVKPKIIRSTD